MYFEFTEEQKLIQISAKKIFQKFYPEDEIRNFIDNPKLNKEFINSISNNGFLGIIAPDDFGQNLGLTDALPIFIESGSNLIPFPLLENILGAKVLGDAEHELCSQIIEGESLITIGWEEVEQGAYENSEKISGVIENIPFAEESDWLLIPISRTLNNSMNKEVSLVLINLKNKNVSLERSNGMDLTYPIYKVSINDYEIEQKHIIVEFNKGKETFEEIKNIGSIFISAELYGASQAALSKSVQYTKERLQFGKRIGEFQSLKHIAADRYVDVVSELAAVQYASWEFDTKQGNYPISIAIAKVFNSETALKTIESAIQLQGGIAYTWENELHLYLKRVLRFAYAIGDPNYYREKIAKVILD